MFKHHALQRFGRRLNTYEYFHSLEVVGCGSETQLEVGGNLGFLNKLVFGLYLVLVVIRVYNTYQKQLNTCK